MTTPSYAVDVHVASMAPGVSLGRPAGDRLRTRYLAERVTDVNPVRPLLGDDPDRAGASIQVTSQPVMVGDTQPIAVGPGTAVATLPAGATLTAIDIRTTVGVGSTSTTVVITGVLGGPYTFSYISPSAGIFPFTPKFEPMPAASPTAIPTVTFTENANTGGGNMNISGVMPAGGIVLCASEADARQNPPAGAVLPAGSTAPWPVRGQGAVWAAQQAPGTICDISVTADYAVSS